MSTLIRRRNSFQDLALKWSRERKQTARDPMSLVYFVEATEANAIKIGRTTQLDRRFSTLQMACPFELKLLGTLPGDGEHEARIHWLFAREHMRGEWFRNGEHLRTFIDAVLKLPDSQRAAYVEREPSVPNDICRSEAEAEADRCIRNTFDCLVEEIGAWEACQVFMRAANR